jgi:hypothetical protein
MCMHSLCFYCTKSDYTSVEKYNKLSPLISFNRYYAKTLDLSCDFSLDLIFNLINQPRRTL